MKQILLLTFLALGYQSASAQSLLQTFGSGANQFTMEFVTIGNPNNAADTTGIPNPAGSVAYTYNLGKYEVSREQIEKGNAAGSLGMTYPSASSTVNKPAIYIGWYEAARYVNWLNTSTGGTAAYKFVGGTFQLWSPTDAGYNANNLFRNSLAKYWLPSSNEWYKGAYGSPNGTWYNYPTGSNSAPAEVASGTTANTAVYGYGRNTGLADITNAGGLSAWGTMAQGGNAYELMETASDGINDTAGEFRELRGGYSSGVIFLLDASYSSRSDPRVMDYATGFRVASVPEPSAFSLLAIGLGGLAVLRRRK